jgi:NhaA family Na+:H+ antiporter
MAGKSKKVIPSDARIDRVLGPFQEFIRLEAAGGLVLLACTIVALICANSAMAESYHALWATTFTVGIDAFSVSKPLLLWVNDGLMAVFFFLVGLEIKRELLVGELSSPRKAAIPIFAAIGGMTGPALLFLFFNRGGAGASGWGVPMATDIAFAVGLLALLGSRVPIALKVFLTALAIVDDLGAVLVIAIFYTNEIKITPLAIGGGILVVLALLNLAGVRRPTVYLVFGIALWIAVLKSGVHATIAGVAAAMTIPATMRISSQTFTENIRRAIQHFDSTLQGPEHLAKNIEKQAAVSHLEEACEAVTPPLLRIEHGLHPWVAFVIMPIFALANAGVVFGDGLMEALRNPVAYGIAIGLFFGNQIGITLMTWIPVKLGIGTLPTGMTWRQVHALSALAGIGFTMSLFIAGLAFEDPALHHAAKVGILLGSVVSGVVGLALVRSTLSART